MYVVSVFPLTSLENPPNLEVSYPKTGRTKKMSRPFFLKRKRTTTSLASLGGTFVGTGGQPGRQGICIPEDEDQRDDRERLINHDPLRSISEDEREYRTMMAEPFEDDSFHFDEYISELGLAQLLSMAQTTGEQIFAAAEVVLEDPYLLLSIYDAAMNINGVRGVEERETIRNQTFDLLNEIFNIMLLLKSPDELDGKLLTHCGDGFSLPTVRSGLASRAREEALDDFPGRRVATEMLARLGHPDPFETGLG